MAVQLSAEKLKVFVMRSGGGAEREMNQRGIRIVNTAKQLCSNDLVNVDTNRLRSSIRHELRQYRNGMVLSVGSDVEYAAIVHEGRRGFSSPTGKALGPMTLGGQGGQFRMYVGPAAPRPFLKVALRTTN
jgi:hypothetical protein